MRNQNGGSWHKKRAAVGVADQLLYSLGNFALTVLVARSASPRDFGAYSLLIATYLIVSAVMRGLTSETLVVRYSASDVAEWRENAGDAGGASVVLGLVSGGGMVAFGLLGPAPLSGTAICLGLMLPGLAVQDYMRFAALSRGRPALALANDSVQIGIQSALSVVLVAFQAHKPWLFVGAWGAGAYVGAVAATVLLRLPPRPHRVRQWFGVHGAMAFRYGADDFAGQGSQQATAYIVAGVAGLAAAGALRGAQTAFGPPSILNLGVQAAVTPELVRVKTKSVRRMRRYAMYLGLFMGLLGGAWGAVLLVLPASVGHSLFGATWTNVRPLLIFFLIAKTADGIRVGATAGLRALGAADRTLLGRVIVTGLGLAFQVTGAAVDGARGAAIATALVTPLQAAAWYAQYRLAADEATRIQVRARHERAWQALLNSVPEHARPDDMAAGWALGGDDLQ